MLSFSSELLSWLADRFCSRAELELEVIALRHQLAVLHRQRPGRPQLFALDRLLWIWLYRVWAAVSANMTDCQQQQNSLWRSPTDFKRMAGYQVAVEHGKASQFRPWS